MQSLLVMQQRIELQAGKDEVASMFGRMKERRDHEVTPSCERAKDDELTPSCGRAKRLQSMKR